MALTSWYIFNFFDVSEVKFADAESSALFNGSDVNCICTGSDNVFLACADGTVRILSQSFKVVRSFRAHDAGMITHMMQVEGTSLLVTVAEDLPNDPVLKVWALDKLDKKTGMPRCQSTITIQNSRQPFPISAFAAVDNLSQLAVGFANGAVTIVRGDLIHDRGTKQRTVFESKEPITGVQFREGGTSALFITTTSKIFTLVLSGRGQGQPARTLDENGCAAGCMTADRASKEIIVARDDAIHYYGLHGRGQYFNYGGRKSLITSYKDYITVVSSASTTVLSRSTLGSVVSGRTSNQQHASTLTILNPDFRFVAHLETLPAEIKSCFIQWNDLFIHTMEGKLLRYHEKSLQEEFDILFQRNLFVYAIQLAKKASVDTAQQNIIFRKYGDYLFQAKDYDTAMQQYLKAIENTEPSQIIRKFLDNQRIHNLIDYLEELHERGKASSDHTILLLNCYAKLKDVPKLENFIKTRGESQFDVDAAISMCRQGGFFDQAAYLARKHSEHDVVVSVLIEDSKKYPEAIAYIWRLEPELAYHSFSKYATVLLAHCPEDTTRIFIDYYTGQFRPKKDAVFVTAVPSAQAGGSFATSAVQNLAALLPLPYMNVSNADTPTGPDQKVQTRVIESTDEGPPPEYKVPKPRSAFSAFVDHPNEFLKFLEACIAAETVREEDKIDIYTTLFEMYLRIANEKQGSEKKEWESKARQLVEGREIPIDASNVLLLSDLERFRDGTTLVKEQQGLRFDIFRSYTSAKDTSGVIRALKKYGPNEPQLYPAALAYFTSSREALDEAGDEVDAVLHKIDQDGLMAPLQVVQTLSTNAFATMGLVKQYLQDSITREREEISSNRRTIKTYRDDTAQKQTELRDLSTKPHEFKATRCSACGYTLDTPTVHFMCDHSFHQRCLNIAESETVETVECPRCAVQNATTKSLKKAQEEFKEKHDLFKDSLSRSRDGFATVAEWFGRGVMSSASIE